MRTIFLAVLLSAAGAAPLAAQGRTVTEQLQGRSNERAQYHQRVEREASNMVALYQAFWNAGSAGDIEKMYADDAVVYAPGEAPVRGRRAVRRLLDERLRSIGAAELVVKEFGTSGDLAYVVVAASGAVQDEAQVRTVSHTLMLVLRRNWRDEWQIAAEVGGAAPDAPAAAAP